MFKKVVSGIVDRLLTIGVKHQKIWKRKKRMLYDLAIRYVSSQWYLIYIKKMSYSTINITRAFEEPTIWYRYLYPGIYEVSTE